MRDERVKAMDVCIDVLKEAILKTDKKAFEHCGTEVPSLMVEWIEDIWNEVKQEITID